MSGCVPVASCWAMTQELVRHHFHPFRSISRNFRGSACNLKLRDAEGLKSSSAASESPAVEGSLQIEPLYRQKRLQCMLAFMLVLS